MLVDWQMFVDLAALLNLPENLVRVALSEALEGLLARLSPENPKVSSKVEPLVVPQYKQHTVTNLSVDQLIVTYIVALVPAEPSALAVAATLTVAETAVALVPFAVAEDQPVPVAKVKLVLLAVSPIPTVPVVAQLVLQPAVSQIPIVLAVAQTPVVPIPVLPFVQELNLLVEVQGLAFS